MEIASAVTAQPSPTGGESGLRDRAAEGPIVRVDNLEKRYPTARGELALFRGLNLEVHGGEMVAIVGQSGAGKSTLLHILGALDAPSAGTVYCASTNLAHLRPREAAAFRNREIGYVWQFHYLLPEFTALENVALPLLARGTRRTGAPGDRSSSLGWKTGAPGDRSSSLGWKTGAPGDRSSSLGWKREALGVAANWLREVGLEDRADHRPGELSGGEQQRVALARALVGNPRILLADEPTGDLDAITAARVFDLIECLHRDHGLTSILVTHNLDLAARCTRTLRLENGRLAPLAAAPPIASYPQAADGKSTIPPVC